MRVFSVKLFSRDEWLEKMDKCYLSSFGGLRPKYLEKCDFALVVERDAHPCGFVTCKEMDSETVYWQWGGAFEAIKKTTSVIESYLELIFRIKEMGFKRITTRIENTNIAMLKLAMRCGFLIVGTWCFRNEILLELVNELGG